MSFLGRRNKKVVRDERRVIDPVEVEYPFTARTTSRALASPVLSSPVFPPYTAPNGISDVTVVIVNFKTLWLTRKAYKSLLRQYDLPVIIVDNGSGDTNTTEWVRAVDGICNTSNLGHGPAMDAAIKKVTTPYVLTLDSDCTVLHKGWLEEMLDFFLHSKAYAIGWLRYVDRLSGVPLEWHLTKQPGERFVPYVHPAVGLYDVAKYKTLRPFINHGAPALWNMIDAEASGYLTKSYPVFDYVEHLIAGTRRMYDGRWNPNSSESPTEWKAKGDYPI